MTQPSLQNTNFNIINVGVYGRVSTVEQAEQGYSIEAQLEVLHNLCKAEHKVVFRDYVDAGISGKSISNRPALQQLLKDVENGEIHEVLVWRLDRISRKMADTLNILEHLKRHDVKFRSYSEKEFDTTTPTGRLNLQIAGVIAEYQRGTIVENVQLGMKQRARNGKWNGGQLLGYDVVQVPSAKGNDSILQINPIEAALVRKIFQMYANGKGLRGIANQLNIDGYKTKPGNAFSAVAIKTIINNPAYIGKIRYNVRENWSEKRRKGINPNPIIVDGEHEPIIEQDLWETVQALFKKKSVSPPRTFEGTYPLTGLMRCPQCGSTLGAHRTSDKLKNGTTIIRRYYVCNKFRNGGRKVCSSNSVRADLVEEFVFERLAEVVHHPKVLDDIIKKLNKDRTRSVKPLQKEIEALDKEMTNLEGQRKRYMKLFETGNLDDDIFVERVTELKSEHTKLARRKAEAEDELRGNTSAPIPAHHVRLLLTQFQRILSEAPPETQKTLLQTTIKQIHVQNGRKVESIELELDPTLQNHFFEQAPSAKPAAGAFAFSKQKPTAKIPLIL
ncbi:MULTISPECIES: recombinase family protein [unclassified Paenibacillus]|uniref:recombinase family protein n=1 Tax=unclassified Paenibacillus TaxID=185978 RepID=UPI002476F6A9|nr:MULTISPECIES: recombinase family protein [unclassified Paenibacillus]MDH6429057.1 site-specific DNA recombinase [Paenibacillus sp. PastH-4]MDH6445262.1 site-specific DNA recombinase [Paenibacillus sp. PastF-4]MDH6529152.1 site-specific DNA recombinase [Paenibacillus sp. PastH-3]